MDPDRHDAEAKCRAVPRLSVEAGFSVLELLVIIVIVSTVVALGVPMLHSRAKASVLEANLQSMGSLVSEYVLEGYRPQYREAGEGDPDKDLSARLELSLNTEYERVYVNPLVDADERQGILNVGLVTEETCPSPPAVLLTNSADYQYLVFGRMSEEDRRLVRGSLIIAFNETGRSIDVFYVDEDGRKSTDMTGVSTG